MNRRQFLGGSAAALGALGLNGTLLSRLSRAAEQQDRYFIFLYFEGGWDHMLGLDPRDPDVFTDDLSLETGIQPAYSRIDPSFSHQPIEAGPFTLGPAVGELTGVTDHFSIVRGINMATLTHEVGRRYFITGRPPSGNNARGSSVATLAASQMAADHPVPNLALSVETYIEQHIAPWAAAMPIASVNHLRYILRESLGIPTVIRDNVRDALADYWEREVDCELGGAQASQLAQNYRDNRRRARELVKAGLHANFEFDSDLNAPIRAHYGFDLNTSESPAGRAALAATAIKTGLSRCVSTMLVTGLDTHDNTWAGNHPVLLRQGFTALARLITDLRDSEAPGGGSYLDRTTIVAFSEFGRSPRLNTRNGRDHLLTNCCLLAGAGIVPGQVVGSSSNNGFGPNLIDLGSGQPDEQGESLKPEHVMTTFMSAGGLEPSSLQALPLATLLA